MNIENKAGIYIVIDKNRSDEENIVYKIGKSKNVKNRINQIKKNFEFLGQNHELEVFTIIYCNQITKLERNLHTILKFAKLMDRHEWFKSSIETLNRRLFLISLADYK
jgi:excinuclease UvrABC nuclease subunit